MNVICSKKMFHSRKSLHGHEGITFDTQVDRKRLLLLQTMAFCLHLKKKYMYVHRCIFNKFVMINECNL